MSNVEIRWIDPQDEKPINLTLAAYDYIKKRGIKVQHRAKVAKNDIEVQVLKPLPFELKIIEITAKQVVLKERELFIEIDDTGDTENKKKICDIVFEKKQEASEICIAAFEEIKNFFRKYNIIVASASMWCGYDENEMFLASDITPVMFELLDFETRKPFPSNDVIYDRLLG